MNIQVGERPTVSRTHRYVNARRQSRRADGSGYWSEIFTILIMGGPCNTFRAPVRELPIHRPSRYIVTAWLLFFLIGIGTEGSSESSMSLP